MPWVNLMKGAALLWIFLNHAAERLFGFPYIANPDAGWPSMAERVGQLEPIAGHGWVLNLFRYGGWLGDHGVQLFLILSGFGLTWGLLGKGRLALGPFYRRRAERIFPLWWTVHLLAFLPLVLAGRLDPDAGTFWLSLVGFRAAPELLYALNPAWWYVGLLLQLYLVYPVLWRLLSRLGPGRLLVVACLVSFAVRLAGLLYFEGWLDAWSRGAVFITRLPEFVLGMALASWCREDPERFQARLSSWRTLLGSLALFLLGAALALDLAGMAAAPFLIGAGAFGVLFAPLRLLAGSWLGGPLGWVGRHSYSLYLVHCFLVQALVPGGIDAGLGGILARMLAAFLLSVPAALAAERLADLAGRAAQALGALRAAAAALAGLLVLGSVLLLAEALVRAKDPQENLGWGERPALMPDERFGWRLKPGQTTRLRWESYDYVVRANSLGFPGPEYPEEKPAGVFRILTTGDAFTSAEGVDTELAWPRLLEQALRAALGPESAEVLNFAVTGYGPDQYAAVVEAFAPRFEPDLVIVEVFVNDFEDAATGFAAIAKGIGFGLPDQDGWRSYARLSHLRRYLAERVVKPLLARARSRPSPPLGYFFGYFSAFERSSTPARVRAGEKVRQALGRIREAARAAGAELLVVMAPASIQVGGPDELDFYPSNVDFRDRDRFDPDHPQRLMQEIADSLGIWFLDLRPALSGGGSYQRRNMHWTANGHRVVARAVWEALDRKGLPARRGR